MLRPIIAVLSLALTASAPLSAQLTVHWKHSLPAEQTVGSTTYRIARLGSGGQITPPGEEATQSFANSTWQPSEGSGLAKPVTINGQKYRLGFWWTHCKYKDNEPKAIYTNNSFSLMGDGQCDAIAYYVWDFGSGAGANGVYFDAFDATAGVFIPDDFVDVTPDLRRGLGAGGRTAAANNGFLGTEDLPASTTVQARDPILSKPIRYTFIEWPIIIPLSGMLVAEGKTVTLGKSSDGIAIASYAEAGQASNGILRIPDDCQAILESMKGLASLSGHYCQQGGNKPPLAGSGGFSPERCGDLDRTHEVTRQYYYTHCKPVIRKPSP